MKGYYDQLSELKVAEKRLENLKDRRELLWSYATSVTSTTKDVVSFSGNSSGDKMANYIIRCEELDKEIEEVQKEIEILQRGLKQMEAILKNISGLEERIFRLYYIENKTPLQMSYIIPCSQATIYRYLKKINKKTQNDKK